MSVFWQLLRRATQKPSVGFFSIASLTLGLAAATAIFSVVNSVVLQPLPFPEAETLVRIYEQSVDGKTMPMTEGNFSDLRARQSSFSALARFIESPGSVRAGKNIVQAQVYYVDASYFEVLQIKPLRGRSFDELDLATPQVLVNESAWRQLFPDQQLGAEAQLKSGGDAGSVIGILPQSASLVPGPAVYFRLPPETASGSRSAHNYDLIARLKPGFELAAAQNHLLSIAGQIVKEQGTSIEMRNFKIVPWLSDILGAAEQALWLVLAASVLLLLIGCANVANLFLADLLLERRAFATRAALGATPGQLSQGPLLELLSIAIVSTALAWPIAKLSVRFLSTMLSDILPRAHVITLTPKVWWVLVFASACCLTLIGSLVAVWLKRARLEHFSSTQERGQTMSAKQLLVQKIFIVLQTGFLVTLLLGSVAIGRSVDQLSSQPLGFDAANTYVADISLPDQIIESPDFSAPMTGSILQAPVRRANGEFERYLGAIRALPEVRSVGLINALPLTGFSQNGSYVIESLPASSEPAYPLQELRAHFEGAPKDRMGYAEFRQANASYFDAMGIRLLRGRMFDDSDRVDGVQSALISESEAKRSFAGRDPIGSRIQFGNMDGDARLLSIVGVIADVREHGLGDKMSGTIYANSAQRRLLNTSVSLVIRVDSSLSQDARARLMQKMREVLQPVVASQPIQIRAMQDTLRDALGVRLASNTLFFAFSLAALVLAALGLFSLTRFVIGQQSRSLSLRAALGATTTRILSRVYGDWAIVQVVGMALGLIAAHVLLRGLESQLFNVTIFQLDSVATVCTMVLLVTALATAWPARQAAKADPGLLLR